MATVVTIDGPAGVGKSSVARRVAERLGWAYLDSGALYRTVALRALEEGTSLDDGEGLAALAERLAIELGRDGHVRVGGLGDLTSRLRSSAVTAAVATVAAHPAVRKVLLRHQRAFAEREGRIVAEGRDLGTVVFPDAALKVYLDADPEVRARRRVRQEGACGAEASAKTEARLERVRAGLSERDERDRDRAVAPLRPAEGAWRLDTTSMTLDEVVAAVVSHVRSGIPAATRPEPPA